MRLGGDFDARWVDDDAEVCLTDVGLLMDMLENCEAMSSAVLT